MKNLGMLLTVCALTLFCITASAQCSTNFTAVNIPSTTAVQFSTQPVTSGTYIVYSWDFGDYSGQYNQVNTPTITHGYSSNGVYSVTMQYADTSSSPGCYTSVTNTVVVTGGSCNDSIDFSATAFPNGVMSYYGSYMNNPNYVYSWNFGDSQTGSGNSTSHTYTASGVYTVVMTASTSPIAVCSYSATHVVTVNVMPCPLNASFSSVTAGNQATLTSTSSGTTTSTQYYWQFGDGSAGYGSSIAHTYSNNGTYNASLSIMDSSIVLCQDTVTQPVSITNGTCLINASFVMYKDTMQAFTWYVSPTVPSGLSAVQWNWGDGSSSNTLYTTHTFSAAGTYSICLSVTATCGSSTTYCLPSAIYRTSGQVITVIVKADGATGIKELKPQQQPLKIVPNPSDGLFSIQLPENKVGSTCTISIFDMLGKQVWTKSIDGSATSNMNVDLTELPAGSYVLMLSGDDYAQHGRIILTE